MESQQSPWFEGSVSDAVSKATNEKLLFLSFIYDDDENSTKMRELLCDNEISALMKSKTVAIEMKKGSETFTLFSQIFQTFFCPCLAFIQNGRLIYFLNAEATKEKVIENINKYSDLEQSTNAPTENTQSSNQNSNTNLNNSTNSIHTPTEQEKEKERERERELNEKKKAERIEELKKKKQDNDARRKQILEQINNDRKERESRNNSYSSKGSSSESLHKLLNEKPKSVSNSDNALISVRYLDGSLLRQEFKRTQKLSDIRKWIDETTKAKGIFKPYSLETKYPEHQFSFGEETKSLIDLNLDDTDLLICKPVTKVFSANPKQSLDVGKYFTANFFKDLLFFLYAFILSLNIFKDPMKKDEDEEGQASGSQTFNFKKGKIRINSNEKKMGTINDIRNDNKKPQETYNGNSTNQQ